MFNGTRSDFDKAKMPKGYDSEIWSEALDQCFDSDEKICSHEQVDATYKRILLDNIKDVVKGFEKDAPELPKNKYNYMWKASLANLLNLDHIPTKQDAMNNYYQYMKNANRKVPLIESISVKENYPDQKADLDKMLSDRAKSKSRFVGGQFGFGQTSGGVDFVGRLSNNGLNSFYSNVARKTKELEDKINSKIRVSKEEYSFGMSVGRKILSILDTLKSSNAFYDAEERYYHVTENQASNLDRADQLVGIPVPYENPSLKQSKSLPQVSSDDVIKRNKRWGK